MKKHILFLMLLMLGAFPVFADGVQVGVTLGGNTREGWLGAPGTFLVSRGDTAGELEVMYSVGGTAVAGQHYEPLSGKVTIADGAASATIEVVPRIKFQGDHTLTLTLTEGDYTIDPSAASATMTIKETVFEKEITFTTSGYAGTETLTNFPVLVRLSTAIPDFNYAEFQCPNGGDLRFVLTNGTVLAHEVQQWNESGESLAWVRIPELTADVKFKAYYGSKVADIGTPSTVWSDKYLGVWHLDEVVNGETVDATGHGFTMTNKYPEKAVMDDLGGVVGGAISGNKSEGFTTAPFASFFNSKQFTMSAWFHRRNYGFANERRYLVTKRGADTNGLDFRSGNDSLTMLLRTDGWTGVTVPAASVGPEWKKLTLAWNDKTFTVYTNGVVVQADQKLAAPTHTYGFAIGNNTSLAGWYFPGAIDEARFAMFVESADWAKAEYDTEVNTSFLSNTGVTAADDPSRVWFTEKPTVAREGNAFVMTAKTQGVQNGAQIYAIYGPSYPFAHTNFLGSVPATASTISGAITAALPNERCYFGVYSACDGFGHTCEQLGEGFFYNGEIGVAVGEPISEGDLWTTGRFTISRPTTIGDQVVHYTIGGTAVAGRHYEAIPASVVIPDGETSVTIVIKPLFRSRGDHTLTLTLTGHNYLLNPATTSATMTISSVEVCKKIAFKVSGYTGTETLTNFPVLVRLSESIPGFSYDDFKLPNGGDLRFVLKSGQGLQCEIEKWNEEGESLVWVRIPELTSDTEFIAYYESTSADPRTPTRVWSENFLGVWHYDEIVDGATPDATGHGLTATNRPDKATGALPNDGRFGGCFDNNKALGFRAGSYTNLFSANVFTISGWFKLPAGRSTLGANARYVSAKTSYDTTNGFEFDTSNTGNTSLCVTSSGGKRCYPPCTLKDESGNYIHDWIKYTLCFRGSKFDFYENGVAKLTDQTIASIKHGGEGFCVGNNARFGDGSYNGYIDEIRFAMFAESADWAKAEYDNETSDSFLVNSGVKTALPLGVVVIYQ